MGQRGEGGEEGRREGEEGGRASQRSLSRGTEQFSSLAKKITAQEKTHGVAGGGAWGRVLMEYLKESFSHWLRGRNASRTSLPRTRLIFNLPQNLILYIYSLRGGEGTVN